MVEGTYGIRGLPRPPHAESKTKTIPYVTNLPLRREISTLASSQDTGLQKQWTLFVLAMERFKAKPVGDKLSYFRVAGLHAYPCQPWDNAPAPVLDSSEGPSENSFGGYCNHNRVSFPTWHRPYMLLFEQCVWENMKAIIHQWATDCNLSEQDAADWYSEADQWRMPYWDWGGKQAYTDRLVYPDVLLEERVRISPPAACEGMYPADGLYANPLLRFENPEKDSKGGPRPFGDMPSGRESYNVTDNPVEHNEALPGADSKDGQWFPWSQTSTTSRYGIRLADTDEGFSGLHGVNNSHEGNGILLSLDERSLWYEPRKTDKSDGSQAQESPVSDYWWNPGSISDALNRMFSPGYNSTWRQFASTKWFGESRPGDRTGYLSLEYIHNNVHNLAGGSKWETGIGHLSDVPVAAFDPLFWLLHCQLDRLLAIWQCLYWDLWWDGIPSHHADGPSTLLEPFHTKDDGDVHTDVWTSQACRNWTDLNYQYDDLWEISKGTVGPDGTLDETSFKDMLMAHINQIYPGTAHTMTETLLDPTEISKLISDPVVAPSPCQWNDYIISVVYDRYALNGLSYTIEFYLGAPASQSQVNFQNRNLVGEVYTFSSGVRAASTSCGNCTAQIRSGVLSCGQVPLTIALLNHLTDDDEGNALKGLSEFEVEEYLNEHLHWRFVQLGGAVVDASQFPRTQIQVLRGTGQYLPNERSGVSQEYSTVYSDYTPIPGVTSTKPWGFRGSMTKDLDHSEAISGSWIRGQDMVLSRL